MSERRPVVRPPWLRRPTAIPRGPREYTFDPAKTVISEFTNPPPGFVTATTSASEWIMYLALAKIFRAPDRPSDPPFWGAPGIWAFQQAFAGGRQMAGGAVVDFIIYANQERRVHENLLMRLVTERFHIFTSAMKLYTDERQLMHLNSIAKVIDVYEEDILGDPTGAKACRHLVEIMEGYERPNPLQSSMQRRFRGWRPNPG